MSAQGIVGVDRPSAVDPSTDDGINRRTGEHVAPEDAPSSPTTSTEHPRSRRSGLHVFFLDARKALKLDELGREIAQIAVPASMALAADPLASLVDTAFIGRIGTVQLAAVGVSISVFNQVSKVAIYPLVSVSTSFVAEEIAAWKVISSVGQEGDEAADIEMAASGAGAAQAAGGNTDTQGARRSSSSGGGDGNLRDRYGGERKYLSSVSSSLVVGGVLGLLQSLLLIFAGKFFLNLKSGSDTMIPARQYLTLRAIGSPAVLFSLAMQGIFRGFKDTKTPLYATVAGDLTNIILDPIFIFVFRMGVSGAAMAHVISQYLISIILLWRLQRKAEIVPRSISDLKFSRFLKCGFLLLIRVMAVTFCITSAASMAARRGSIPMAAFQICLQVWLSTSLLADGLAVAGQAILAGGFARADHHKIVATTSRVLQLSVPLGLALSVIIGVGMRYGARAFTEDADVLRLVHRATPFISGTQPINSIAFVLDGINFGASDYAYSAYSMVLVAMVSMACLFLLSSSGGFIGIWGALAIYMALRMSAGLFRMGAARGPWFFLRRDSSVIT